MGILRILDREKGDKQILLARENRIEAEKEFKKATQKGYFAFEVKGSGAKELIKELNIDAEEIIMTSQMVAG